MTAREQILDLKQRISAAVIGQEPVVEQLLIALLANGHLLMEGLPGLAKTRTIKTLAKNLESQFSRFNSRPICCQATSPARKFTREKARGVRGRIRAGGRQEQQERSKQDQRSKRAGQYHFWPNTRDEDPLKETKELNTDISQKEELHHPESRFGIPAVIEPRECVCEQLIRQHWCEQGNRAANS